VTADETALLSAILAAPDDDVPRLVYADYLEDRGDGPRAAFVRLQCEHARRLANSEPVTDDLIDTIRRLRPLVAIADDWLVPAGGHMTFHRGFVQAVRAAGPQAAAVALALLRCAPLREAVFQFSYSVPDPDEGATARLLQRLEDPSSPPFYTPQPRATVGITQLVVLCTPDCPADRVIELFARQAGVVRPEVVLNLWECQLHEAGARWLFEAAAFDRVRAILLNTQLCRLPPTLLSRLRAKYTERLVLSEG
jgi:uncharacterized protein (TIGR02996 family)